MNTIVSGPCKDSREPTVNPGDVGVGEGVTVQTVTLQGEQDPPSRGIPAGRWLAVGQTGMAGFKKEGGRALQPQL